MNRIGVSAAASLDFFTKIDPSFTRSTPAGGAVSLFTMMLITPLLITELYYYLYPEIIFRYSVDTDFDTKLKINVDMTVASPCSEIGADVLDSTNKQSLYTYGSVNEMETHFELDAEQRERWKEMGKFNSYVRAQHHNIHKLILKPGAIKRPLVDEIERPVSEEVSSSRDHRRVHDACRLHGTLVVNKLAGNFHISAGKYLPMPFGHAHISRLGSENVNFSHRIEKLSFGDNAPFIVNALDGVERIATSSSHLYQYYLKVVLTNLTTPTMDAAEMYQYSVTEREIAVNHNAGTHGIPGIYFKYEIDGLKVSILEQRIALWRYSLRLFAAVGGVLAMSGLLNQIATYAVDIVTCKYITPIDIVD